MIYVSAVRAMNQEAVDDVWAAKYPSEQSPSAIGGALDLNQNPPREAFCSVFQYKSTHKRVATALCCWYSFPFHKILSDPVQSRRIKVKLG